jgi:hypothetical protein
MLRVLIILAATVVMSVQVVCAQQSKRCYTECTDFLGQKRCITTCY